MAEKKPRASSARTKKTVPAAASTSAPAPDPTLRRVEFLTRLDGEHRDVILTGEFNGWSREGVRLVNGSGGEWRGSLQLRPGVYQYRLIVDGNWWDDPANGDRVWNDQGSQNCVLRVS